MKNIILILQREYLSRVKKKSFLLLTFLTPLLIAAISIIPGWLAVKGVSNKKVAFLDQSGLFIDKFKSDAKLTFIKSNVKEDVAKASVKKGEFDALIVIPADIQQKPDGLLIFSKKNVSFDLKTKIERVVEKELKNIKLLEAGLTQSMLEKMNVNVSASTKSLEDDGEKDSSSGAATAIGYISAFMIYMSIFIYGSQVMRGVMEEKQSRIVEVIVSSVKPFQLMMGKIIGIAGVGLTQFLLWILLTFSITSLTSAYVAKQSMAETMVDRANIGDEQIKKEVMAKMENSNMVDQVIGSVSTLNIPLILTCFILYFIGGYLLYASYFAAIGSAVDSDTEVQQFMLPVTIPLILAIAMAQFVLMDPDGKVAFWGSMIPLTSPVLMMVRLPFGVPMWQIILSVGILIASFIGMVLFSAKIYKVGILMYGKKASYKEIKKWLFYKG